MDVVLINPPWKKAEGSMWNKVGSIMPPLGLAFIASYLEKENKSVRIMDLEAEPVLFEKLAGEIEKTGVPKYIGITAVTNLIENGLEIAAICRKAFPDAKIVFGGVHPTVKYDEVVSDNNVDYVVRGEGEIAMSQIASGIKIEDIAGLVYKKDGEIKHNREGEFIENLDLLPMPAYHLLPMKKYRASVGATKRDPAISILSSRGCPGKCTYCFGFFMGKRMRSHSPRYLVDQIKMLKKDFGIREITFYDDTFTVYKKNVKEFCRLLKEEKVDITWTCFARVDFMDEEMLGIMKKAGCHQICYGLESGDEQILKNIKKQTTLEKAKSIIKLTKKIGIEARAAFMLGNPGETVETMEKTIKYAIDVDPDIVVFNITTPYPGTEMYDWALENGYLNVKSWSDMDWAKPSMKLPTVSDEDVIRYYKEGQKRFFGRPSYIFRRLLKIRSIRDVYMAFKAIMVIWFK